MEAIRNFYDKYQQLESELTQWRKIQRIIRPNSELYFQDRLFRFIFEYTQYIRYETMIQGIKDQIRTLSPDIPFYLFFPQATPFKVGSENLIVIECFPELNRLQIIDTIQYPVEIGVPEAHILIIDDGIYSGRNMIFIIEQLWKKNIAVSLHFTIITYASGEEGENNIIDHFFGINISFTFMSTVRYPTFVNLMLKFCGVSNRSFIPGIDLHMPLIYFDHKIHPSYVNILSPDLFEHYPDRRPMEIIESILK